MIVPKPSTVVQFVGFGIMVKKEDLHIKNVNFVYMEGEDMTYIEGRPWFTSLMDKGEIFGACANCGKLVHESLFVLDDCYGVYRGECPHCKAINLLDQSGKHGIRGYSSRDMFFVLPTDHEMRMNNWNENVPMRKCDCKECQPSPKP